MRGRSREVHLHVEPSVRPWIGTEGRAVRGSDGGDDRQPETEPLAPGRPVRRETLKGLEQSLDLAGRHQGSGVGHR
jgi:hypothetical protein